MPKIGILDLGRMRNEGRGTGDEGGTRNSEHGMRIEDLGFWRAECRMRNDERGARKCGDRSNFRCSKLRTPHSDLRLGEVFRVPISDFRLGIKPHQLGHRCHAHLLHHTAAMHFDRLFADPEFPADLLVQKARDN